MANAAVLWLKIKERILDSREEAMIKARGMKQQGITKSQIISSLSSKYVNKYFLDKRRAFHAVQRTSAYYIIGNCN